MHVLSDEDARAYLKIGITAREIVRLRWPYISDDEADYLLWERTPYPLITGVHDLADEIADLDESAEVAAVVGVVAVQAEED